jgi:hypothetical protein
MPDSPVEPSAPGPVPADLGERVSRLEGDMRDVKGVLSRLEPLIVRMDAALPHLATKADLAEMRGELSGEIARVRGDLSAQIVGARGDISVEIARVRGELATEIATTRGDLPAALAEKPSKAYLWGVLTALVAAYTAGLAALAVLR